MKGASPALEYTIYICSPVDPQTFAIYISTYIAASYNTLTHTVIYSNIVGGMPHSHMDEWKPVMAMLVFNLISAVMTALVKKALEQGLNPLVLITLRQLVATLFLAPIAYFKER